MIRKLEFALVLLISISVMCQVSLSQSNGPAKQTSVEQVLEYLKRSTEARATVSCDWTRRLVIGSIPVDLQVKLAAHPDPLYSTMSANSYRLKYGYLRKDRPLDVDSRGSITWYPQYVKVIENNFLAAFNGSPPLNEDLTTYTLGDDVVTMRACTPVDSEKRAGFDSIEAFRRPKNSRDDDVCFPRRAVFFVEQTRDFMIRMCSPNDLFIDGMLDVKFRNYQDLVRSMRLPSVLDSDGGIVRIRIDVASGDLASLEIRSDSGTVLAGIAWGPNQSKRCYMPSSLREWVEGVDSENPAFILERRVQSVREIESNPKMPKAQDIIPGSVKVFDTRHDPPMSYVMKEFLADEQSAQSVLQGFKEEGVAAVSSVFSQMWNKHRRGVIVSVCLFLLSSLAFALWRRQRSEPPKAH